MKKICTAVLCILVIVFGTANAFACEFVPLDPTEIDLGDGLIFWMVMPEDEILGYPASGLYKNGELIYTVDVDLNWWYDRPYFSKSAMTFIRVGGAFGSVRFYEQGRSVLTYRVIDLLRSGRDSLLPPFDTWTTYRWILRINHDRENNMLRITTTDNIIITFDLTTGLILSEEEVPEEERILLTVQREYIIAYRQHIACSNIIAAIFVVIICVVLLLFAVKFIRSRKRLE